MTTRILALAAHPDDETLGSAGTLLKHRAAGAELYWLIATEGKEPDWSASHLAQSARQVEQVANAYGMSGIFKLGFPSKRLDTVAQTTLIDAIRNVLSEVRPNSVYLIHRGDVHSDHSALFGATLSVLKPFYMQALGVERILSFETLSSTDAAPPAESRAFVPNVFVDITPFLPRKLEIMRLYEAEQQAPLLPRGESAIRALARYRGSTIGVEYAEAFMLIRQLA
jgi:LmbE family N-acetylglucosaminyl deacetylase